MEYLIKWPVTLSVIIIYVSQVLKQIKSVSFLIYILQTYIKLWFSHCCSLQSVHAETHYCIFSSSTGHCTTCNFQSRLTIAMNIFYQAVGSRTKCCFNRHKDIVTYSPIPFVWIQTFQIKRFPLRYL